MITFFFFLTFSLSGIFSKQIHFSVPQPDETSVSFELELVILCGTAIDRDLREKCINDPAMTQH